MTKKIFRSVCLAAVCVFIASATLFMWVLYDYFSGVQKSQLRMQTRLAAQGVANEGASYFEGLETDGFRITWIAADGGVLYDSEKNSSEMENHLQREEVKQAFSEGFGESSRYSETLTVRSFYCAELLPDGTVIRLSVAQNSLLALIIGMAQPICVIFLFALILSIALAARLSKNIVKPLNTLNLDEPLANESYDEIAPLLLRLSSQQKEIKRQSSDLLRRQREFETVTNGMAEGIVLLNSKKIIMSINPAAVRLLGAENPPIGEFILSVNRSPELREVLENAEEGRHSEKIVEMRGGKYQTTASPVISEDENFGTVLLFLDVTEKEKTERLRREFTANVSHELKTPLQTISGCAELMANGTARREDMRDFSSRIYAESQRMIRLVDDIIKLSRLDEGAGDMRYENIDLFVLAKETAASLEPQANSLGVSVSAEGGETVIYGIPQLVREIIFNLCDNAVKYNRRGGTVKISVAGNEKTARLTVSDTGIGIPEKYRERIFERFYRVDKSHSKEIGGTGLGLSIVKHAVKLHNGSIEVQSEVGRGTEITVELPK
ncbi:MAG: ATP-binding protein [Ruminococcus sp.]|nr:ATP-binding protein [Ruminococcus sp.]MCM1480527.1 ATP-binding protein [Muribaculaceae bacterium]